MDPTQRFLMALRAPSELLMMRLMASSVKVLCDNPSVPTIITLSETFWGHKGSANYKEFLGHLNRTELYVDGKLVGTHRTQMVCPLQTLGSPWRLGFHGIIHSASIYNKTPVRTALGQMET